MSQSTHFLTKLPTGKNSRNAKKKNEREMTIGRRIQKSSIWTGAQSAPEGGVGTGRKGAIAVPVDHAQVSKGTLGLSF
jgi:hypothetical protein